jgi:hypothetical protein
MTRFCVLRDVILRESTYIGYASCAIPLDIVFMHLFNKIFELKLLIL